MGTENTEVGGWFVVLERGCCLPLASAAADGVIGNLSGLECLQHRMISRYKFYEFWLHSHRNLLFWTWAGAFHAPPHGIEP